MPSTKFLFDGTDATQDTTFVDSSTLGASGGTATSATDQKFTGTSSFKLLSGTAGAGTTSRFYNVLADAGRRISFRVRFTTGASPGSPPFARLLDTADNSVLALSWDKSVTGKLTLVGGQTGKTVLVDNTWYRITMSFTTVATTNWRMDVYVDGVLDVSSNNALATLTRVGSNRFQLASAQLGNSGAAWFDDLYIDDGTDYTDPGNIRVTNKRPFANGSANGFTGTGTPSSYGSGNASYVNEQPLSAANFVSVIAVGVTTEEYNLEGFGVGDVSMGNLNIVDYMGWIYYKTVLSETPSIIINNVATAFTSSVNTNTLLLQAAAATTYPVGSGTDIGMKTDATATTVSLFECGIMFAYIPIPTLPMIGSG